MTLRTCGAPWWRQDEQHHDVLQHVGLQFIQVSRPLASLGQTDLERETSFVLCSKTRALGERENRRTETDDDKETDVFIKKKKSS